MRAASDSSIGSDGSIGSDWAIVLAGGDGTRLRELTTDGHGRSVPKQFCSLTGERTLLGDTLARAARVAPPARTVLVVAAQHRAFWSREPTGIPAENVLVQPSNRGTAAGLLWPLLFIEERDPDARVVLLPSDHHVAKEDVLDAALRDAMRLAKREPSAVVLLGLTPDAPETDYGWIVPSTACPGRVAYFAEKPSTSDARQLMDLGGLWNGFLVAAQLPGLRKLFETRLPTLTSSFRAIFALPPGARVPALERLYASLEPGDFSRHVLQRSEPSLRVQRVPPCGWTDLGTPSRVAACLRTMPTGSIPGARRSCPGVDLRRALAGRAVRSRARGTADSGQVSA